MECGSKSVTDNKKGDLNHFYVTQAIPEQYTGKARNLGTAKNSHIGHCTHAAESAIVKVQNIFHGRNEHYM